jgi:TolA-binding protein
VNGSYEICSWLFLREVSEMMRGSCLILLVVIATVAGCERSSSAPKSGKVTSEDVRDGAVKAVDTAVEFSQQTREEFLTKLEARIGELDAEVAKLRERGQELKDEAKEKWNRKLSDFEAKRDAARAKLQEVKESSGEAWKDLQKGAEAAWEDMDKAFHEASQEF